MKREACKSKNHTERKGQGLLREQQDLFHLDHKVCEVGANSGGLTCKHLSSVCRQWGAITDGGCEQGGARELSAQDEPDRLKGQSWRQWVGWHSTAIVQAIASKDLCLEISNGMDGQVQTASFGDLLSPSREGRVVLGADQKSISNRFSFF